MKVSKIMRTLGALSLLPERERQEGRGAFLAALLGGRRKANPRKEEETENKRVLRGSLGRAPIVRPACAKCGATLSRGKCRNRMCSLGARGTNVIEQRLADRRDYRRALGLRLEGSKSSERRAALEAKIAEVEAQIKALRAAA